MADLDLDAIAASLAEIVEAYGTNWRGVRDYDDAEEYMAVTEDSGDPFTVGEQFTAVFETVQGAGVGEFLLDAPKVQAALIGEVRQLRAALDTANKHATMARVGTETVRSHNRTEVEQLRDELAAAREAAAGAVAAARTLGVQSREEVRRLREELAATRAVLAKVPAARCPYHGDKQHSRACQYCESRIRVQAALAEGGAL
jgi:hypothetical protein